MRVLHVTSVHRPFDTRIFVKQASSLALAGHETYLACYDPPAEPVHGVRFLSLGERPASRWRRFVSPQRRAIAIAREIRPDVTVLHDPELLPVAFLLERKGLRAVFDSHEDAPKDLLTRTYAPRPVLKAAATGYALAERLIARRISGVMGPSAEITDRFAGYGAKVLTLGNLPTQREFPHAVAQLDTAPAAMVYVGGIVANRGIDEMMAVADRLGCELHLAGPWDAGHRARAAGQPGYERIVYHGILDRAGVVDLMTRVRVGMCVLHPVPTFLTAPATKLFEYMAAGMPFVVSDFPIWRDLVDTHRCGICVDPLDPRAIAAAVERLLSDDALRSEMGANGRRAFENSFSWESDYIRYERFLKEIARPGPAPDAAGMKSAEATGAV